MKPTTNILLALSATTSLSNAAMILHSTMDNLDVGAGAGADTTASGTYSINNSVGTNGVAGGATHTGTPIATTSNHVTSGVTGKFGQAISIDNGENGGVSYSGITNAGTGSLTVSLWFNFNGSGSNGILVGQGLNNSSGGEGWSIFWENSDLVFRIGQSGFGGDQRASMRQENTSGLTTGWHMATMVIDSTAGEVRGYVDGVIVDTQGGGGPSDNSYVVEGDGIANVNPVILGMREADGNFAPQVDLDDLGIWNEALTTAQINQAFVGGVASVPEPSSTALLGLGGLALVLRRRR